VLTGLGTTLGVGALVGTLGITSTASAQISQRFDALKATEVVIRDTGGGVIPGDAFPIDTERRLVRLNGVRAAGIMWTVRAEAAVGITPPWVGREEVRMPLIATSSGSLMATRPTFGYGRTLSRMDDRRAERVAVLGVGAAARLGIAIPPETGSVVFVEGRPFTILGVITDVARRSSLLFSILIPPRTATEVWGDLGTDTLEVLVETELGAAKLIGRQAPLALRPSDPDRLIALVPPEPALLGAAIESYVTTLFLLLGALSLAIGAISIGNTTFVSVIERETEIGLRRSLGATRAHVSMQFLMESSLVGAVGGITGTCLGAIVVVVISASNRWTPVMDPRTIFIGISLGAAIGMVSGLYPALKAAKVEPVQALRR
jgi:putative ABC transport system permease protein